MRRLIIPILLRQAGCPEACVYCNQSAMERGGETGSERGLPDDAAVRSQIDAHLASALEARRPFGRREIAFYGGTFTGLPAETQARYLVLARTYLDAGSVDELRVSTHPAMVDEDSVARLAVQGVTTVELGVQSSDPAVLRRAGRGYTFPEVVEAVGRLRERGMKVGLQLMPGLPGADAASDLRSAREVLALRPSSLRVYPTLVLRGTPLARDWERGAYESLSLDEALERSAEILELAREAAVPVIRVGVHGASEETGGLLAGPVHPSFGYLARVRAMGKRVERGVRGLGPVGATARLTVAARDLSLLQGPGGEALDGLRRRLAPLELIVVSSEDLAPGDLELH